MECNKDEAFRAKEIAERKYTGGDYIGARKFALKAQKLFPELDGISQMLTTFDVYISAGNRVSNGEVDWYSVLGVTSWADDDTIRKQYRKLALMLHPDKNKSPGADGAFKLVSDAWSLLSDKAKRSAYNQKLNITGLQQKAPTQTNVPPAPPNANGTHHSSNARTQSKCARSGHTSVPTPPSHRTKTFWTICSCCQTHYEYMRIYLNHNLRCPNCQEAFFAVEKDPPPSVLKLVNNSSRQKHQTKLYASGPQVQHNHFSGMAGPGGPDALYSTAAQDATVVQQGAHQQMKRKYEEGWAASHGVDPFSKKGRPDETYRFSNEADLMSQMGPRNGGSVFGSVFEPSRGHFGTDKVYGFAGVNNKPNSQRELSLVELRDMLMAKTRGHIQKKLQEWSRVKQRESRKPKYTAEKGTKNHCRFEDSTLTKDGIENKQLGLFDDCNKGMPTPASTNVIDVPDSDFHNFDLDRTETSFEDDQVWAAYDENDGMPRYYARIHKVLSLKPFRLKISWLNSRNNMEFSSLEWVGSGFLKTCGDFRTGRREITETLNSFSHIVKWTKGIRGVICILPRKGDVWALYRHWSPDWNEHTPDEVIHKYDVVEVVDDFNKGISVIPLIKVSGFKTVFQKHSDPNAVRWIPKEEMFRFSHQVPDHLLTGEETHNSLKSCRELDPAAISLELLQIVTEASEAREVETSTETKDRMVQNLPEGKVDQTAGYSSKAEEGESIEQDEQGEDMKMGT